MRFCATVIIFSLSSCKVADTSLLGEYKAGSYHLSTIILDSNKQFKFWNDGYEFLLYGKNFLYTQGSWTRNENILLLTSISDSLALPRVDIATRNLKSSDKSKFIFLDHNQDSVTVYSVYKNSKTIFARSHGPFPTTFEDSAFKSDTLLFTFTWGFNPVQIVIGNNVPTEYIVTLNTEFKPDYFRNTEFIIRRNKLIRITDKAKFRKNKSNGI